VALGDGIFGRLLGNAVIWVLLVGPSLPLDSIVELLPVVVVSSILVVSLPQDGALE